MEESSYPLVYEDVIIYPCPKLSTGVGNSWGPFYKHGLTLIPAWVSNHMPSEVWDGIT